MLTIYGVPPSVHTRKTILTAIHKGIDYKLEVVVPVIPNSPPANWLSLSPSGLIPAIEDGGFVLGDSTAISLYLEKKQPEPALLPTELKDYGRAQWLNAYVGDTLWRTVVHPLFHQLVVGPNIRNVPTDQAIVDAARNDAAPGILSYLDSQLNGGAFLVGDALSLADLAAASNLITYQYLGFRIDAGAYPRLHRYLRDIIGIDVFQKALAQEKPFAEQMGLDQSFLS